MLFFKCFFFKNVFLRIFFFNFEKEEIVKGNMYSGVFKRLCNFTKEQKQREQKNRKENKRQDKKR